MVRKKGKRKGTRGHLNPTPQEIAAVSQVVNRKDLAPQNEDEGGDGETTAVSLGLQTTVQGQLGFPDKVYLLASVIFQNSHVVKPATHRLVNYGNQGELPLPEVQDQEMQHSAYELAFNTLKYQELLEEIMVDCCLYLTQPMPEDQMSLVAVMLYDFQDRKFLSRGHTEIQEMIEEVRDVENYLLQFKTKLAASLARSRIKHGLLSMECILPEGVRTKLQRSRSLPLYAWVNRLKSSPDEVQGVLKNDGLLQVKSIRQLAGQSFCQDSHCWDTLVFPAQLKAPLSFTKLLRDHELIIQDKSCILPPNAAVALLPDGGDVLMVGCFSGFTVAHTASLIAEKYEGNKNNNNNNNDQPTVYVCTTNITERQSEELQHTVDKMGCKNVKLIPQVFQSLDADDKRLRNVRVILLTPRCSMSAVSNTVKFILQENGDPGLLRDLSHGSIAQSKLEDLAAQQRKDFGHALKFPQVLVVVYGTCSSYQTENEDVVNGVLQEAKASSDQDGEPKQTNFRPSRLHFSSCEQAEATNETEPFFILEPSELNNGCFLAVLMREPEPVVKEAPEDVIAKANAKGILDKIGSNRPNKKENHTRTSTGHTRRLQAKPWSSIPLKRQPQSSRNSSSSSSSSISISIQQGHVNTQQPQQAQPKGSVKSSAVRLFWDSRPKYSTSSAPASSTHPLNDTPTKTTSHALTMTSSTSRTAPPALPVTPLLRPRRAQVVLKPVVLVLPPVHFPSFPPLPQRSGSGVIHSPWNSKRKTPPQPVSVFPSKGFSKGAADKSLPLF